jgi:hypothetical protein
MLMRRSMESNDSLLIARKPDLARQMAISRYVRLLPDFDGPLIAGPSIFPGIASLPGGVQVNKAGSSKTYF